MYPHDRDFFANCARIVCNYICTRSDRTHLKIWFCVVATNHAHFKIQDFHLEMATKRTHKSATKFTISHCMRVYWSGRCIVILINFDSIHLNEHNNTRISLSNEIGWHVRAHVHISTTPNIYSAIYVASCTLRICHDYEAFLEISLHQHRPKIGPARMPHR